MPMWEREKIQKMSRGFEVSLATPVHCTVPPPSPAAAFPATPHPSPLRSTRGGPPERAARPGCGSLVFGYLDDFALIKKHVPKFAFELAVDVNLLPKNTGKLFNVGVIEKALHPEL